MEYPRIDLKATGERIRELRIAHHLKVEEVACLMGLTSEQAVYKWQRGEGLPSVDNLYALSKLFGTTVDDILRGNREEDESPSLPVYRGFKSTHSQNCECSFCIMASVIGDSILNYA